MAPQMTINGDDVMDASLVVLVEEEPGPSPTPEKEATLLGKNTQTSGAPGPASQQVKSTRNVEPAEQTTTPVTFIAPHHCSFLKRWKSWKGIGVDPNNTSMWISAYLKKDSWLPEWWEEFWPLPHFTNGCHRDTQAQYLAHQQVAAFHLLTTQKAVCSACLTPSSLMELKRKEYLGPKDPCLT